MSIEKLDRQSLQVLRYLVEHKEQNSTTLADMVMTHFANDIRETANVLRSLRNKGFVECTIDDHNDKVTILAVTHEGAVYEDRYLDESQCEREKEKERRKWDLKLTIITAGISFITALATTLVAQWLSSKPGV